MTRAQQQISLGLLVASVRPPTYPQYQEMNSSTNLYPLPALHNALHGSPAPPSKDPIRSNPIRTFLPPLSSITSSFPLSYSFIQQLPFWALISFGAYLLGKLGYGVLTFNDVPEAHEELMAQIQEARKDLKKKGVDVD